MGRVLITGFEPFGGEAVNPALKAIECLEGMEVAGCRIVTHPLPVVKGKSIASLLEKIKEVQPELVIAVGQAGGSSELSLERVAINIDDFRIPDNEGQQPIDEPVVAGGPAAYWSTLPIKTMLKVLRSEGIPVKISNSAGTYVCNHVFYGLMHALAQEGAIRRGGFIHIPYLPEQAARLSGQPSVALETVVKGLKLAVATGLESTVDEKIPGGAIF